MLLAELRGWCLQLRVLGFCKVCDTSPFNIGSDGAVASTTNEPPTADLVY